MTTIAPLQISDKETSNKGDDKPINAQICEKKGKNVEITIRTRTDLDLTRIYNRDLFHMLGFKVNIHEPEVPFVPEKLDQDEGKNNVAEPSDNYVPSEKIADILFGPERIPNGYTDLPLELSETPTMSDKVPDKTGFITSIRDYIGHFFIPSASVQSPSNGQDNIVITMPSKNADPLQSLDVWRISKMSPPFSIFCISETNIDYITLENIVQDLMIQLEYFMEKQMIIRKLNLENIYIIDGRYVIVDSDNVVAADDTDKYTENIVAAELAYQLLGKGIEYLEEIKDTRLYGLLKR